MVTKRIRSEYMKKFKDPKWETCSKCYEEMLSYRLTRRLLEHSHNPWFWGESDTDSDSGGRSPTPLVKNQTKDESSKHRTNGELEERKAAMMDKQKVLQSIPTALVPKLTLPEDEHSAHVSQMNGIGETRIADEEQEKGSAGVQGCKQLLVPHGKREQNGEKEGPRPQQNKSSKQMCRIQKVRPMLTQQTKEHSQQSRHPFVLYASGEKDSDISRRKTHNVGPVSSTKEIHESALRAKTRREVERQLQSQRAERRRAKSANIEKARLKVVAPEFNPWLTEYMRCFSVRS